MPNPTVPDFTELGASKLADLLEKGFVITGVCFERQVDGTQPQRGFVDFAGFVGWWRPRLLLTDEQVNRAVDVWFGSSVNPMAGHGYKMRQAILAAHGVADMKGGQDA